MQVGTPFTFCEESGLDPEIRARVLALAQRDELEVFADPAASPTGFPFKLALVEGTLADPAVYETRPRLCDLGYLRSAYRTEDGRVAFRCPGEPVDDYVRKGGDAEDTRGRQCLCNGRVVNLGLGQVREGGYHEPPILTSGEDLSVVRPYLRAGGGGYDAADVVHRLCAGIPDPLEGMPA